MRNRSTLLLAMFICLAGTVIARPVSASDPKVRTSSDTSWRAGDEAVDGDLASGSAYSMVGPGPPASTWWEIDLGAQSVVSSVTVTNPTWATNQVHRRLNRYARVMISPEPFDDQAHPTYADMTGWLQSVPGHRLFQMPGNVDGDTYYAAYTHTFSAPTTARYVRIYAQKGGAQQGCGAVYGYDEFCLALAEVSVRRFPAANSLWALDSDLSNQANPSQPLVASAFTPRFVDAVIAGAPAKALDLPALSGQETLRATNNVGPNGLSHDDNLTNDYTLVMDVNFGSDLSPYQSILQTHRHNDDDVDVFLRTNGGIDLGSATIGAGTFQANTWYRLVIRSRSLGGAGGIGDQLHAFVDGQPIAGSVSNKIDGQTSLAPVFLLFSDDSGDTSDTQVNSVAYWGEALLDEEIGYLGAATAAAIPNPSGPARAIALDGSSGYLDLAELALLFNENFEFTIELWMKATASDQSGAAALVGVNDVNGGNVFHLFMGDGDGQDGRLHVYDGNGPGWVLTGPYVGDGQWHHVAYARDRSSAALYVDGVLSGSHAFSYKLGDQLRLSIGQEFDGSSGSDFFKGNIDEFRFWRSTRTGSEIVDAMDQALRPDHPGLAALLSFDADSGLANDQVSGASARLVGGVTGVFAGAPISPSLAGIEERGAAFIFGKLLDVGLGLVTNALFGWLDGLVAPASPPPPPVAPPQGESELIDWEKVNRNLGSTVKEAIDDALTTFTLADLESDLTVHINFLNGSTIRGDQACPYVTDPSRTIFTTLLDKAEALAPTCQKLQAAPIRSEAWDLFMMCAATHITELEWIIKLSSTCDAANASCSNASCPSPAIGVGEIHNCAPQDCPAEVSLLRDALDTYTSGSRVSGSGVLGEFQRQVQGRVLEAEVPAAPVSARWFNREGVYSGNDAYVWAAAERADSVIYRSDADSETAQENWWRGAIRPTVLGDHWKLLSLWRYRKSRSSDPDHQSLQAERNDPLHHGARRITAAMSLRLDHYESWGGYPYVVFFHEDQYSIHHLCNTPAEFRTTTNAPGQPPCSTAAKNPGRRGSLNDDGYGPSVGVRPSVGPNTYIPWRGQKTGSSHEPFPFEAGPVSWALGITDGRNINGVRYPYPNLVPDAANPEHAKICVLGSDDSALAFRFAGAGEAGYSAGFTGQENPFENAMALGPEQRVDWQQLLGWNSVDAAMTYLAGKIYFFSGDQYALRSNESSNVLQRGKISDKFPGVKAERVDAAFYSIQHGKVYLIEGEDVWIVPNPEGNHQFEEAKRALISDVFPKVN